jgi:hypothetical protein
MNGNIGSLLGRGPGGYFPEAANYLQGLQQQQAQPQPPAPQGLYGKFNNIMNNPNALSAINTLAGALQQKGRYAGSRGTDAMLSTLLKGNQGPAVGRTMGQGTPPNPVQPQPPMPQRMPQVQPMQEATPPPAQQSRIQRINPQEVMAALSGGMAPATRGIENPTNGTAANAGNAVPTAPQAQNPIAAALGGVPQIPKREYPTMPFEPFAQNPSIAPNSMDLMMLNALNEPGYLPDLIKQRQANEVARRNSDINRETAIASRMNAVTNQRTADMSEAGLPSEIQGRRARALADEATAKKTGVETQQSNIKLKEEQRLAALGPEGVLAEVTKRTEAIERAKKAGDLAAVRATTEALAKEQDSIPVPAELRKDVPYKTMGDVLRYGGTEVYKQAMQDVATMARTKVNAAAQVSAAREGNPYRAMENDRKMYETQLKTALDTITHYDKTTRSSLAPATGLEGLKPARTPEQEAMYNRAQGQIADAQRRLSSLGVAGTEATVQPPSSPRATSPIEEEVVKNGVWYTKRKGVWGQESEPRPATLGPLKKAKGEALKESATIQFASEEPTSTREALRRRRVAAPKNE